MNYYVIMRSLVDISEKINHQLDYWKNELTEVLNAIEAYKTVSSIQGATGEALNDYLDSVHSTIISAIGSEFGDYSSKITPYVNDYLSLEESEEGIIWSETIQNQIDIIPKEKTIIDDISSRVTDVIGSVSDIVSPSVTPYIVPIDMAYDEMTIFLTKLDEAVEEIESNHASDMEDIKSLIITLKGIIEPNKTLILEDVTVQKVGEIIKKSLRDSITHGIYNELASGDALKYVSSHEYRDIIDSHYEHNSTLGWKSYLDSVNAKYSIDEKGRVHLDTEGTGFYIEEQAFMDNIKFGIDIFGDWSKKKFFKGKTVVASYTSCEVIATYNTMAFLSGGYSSVEFPDLLKEFEGRGTALAGNFGTAPIYVDTYLKRQGYKTEFVTGFELGDNGKGYKYLQDKYSVYILSTWNSGDNIPWSGVHTMAITKNDNGRFSVHNDYKYEQGTPLKEYDTLREAAYSYNDGNSEPICLIGVSK